MSLDNKIEVNMRVPRSVSTLVLAICGFVLQSCTTFYSSSIMGHDASTMPVPERDGRKIVNSLGVSVKVAPTASVFTYDSTQSGQLNVNLQSAVPISDNARFCFELGAGGYFSQNTIFLSRKNTANAASSNTQNILNSTGYIVEGKLSFILDQGKVSPFLGIDVIHNREFGDYLQFRKDIATPTSNSVNSVFETNKVNSSPDGSTLEGYFTFGNRWRFDDREFYDLSYGMGVALPNWPADKYTAMINKLTFTYSLDNLWWAVSVEDLNLLNVGVGIQAGVRLF